MAENPNNEKSAKKRSVMVELAGAKYRMVSDAQDGHLQALADLVNERLKALGERATRQASPAHMMAVVALGLAEDLRTSEERLSRIENVTRDTITEAISRIDDRLASSAIE